MCTRPPEPQGDRRRELSPQGGQLSYTPGCCTGYNDPFAENSTFSQQRKVVCVYSRPVMARRRSPGRGHPTCSLFFCLSAHSDASKRLLEQKAVGGSPEHSTYHTSGKVSMAGKGQNPGGPSFTPSSAMTSRVRGRESGKLGAVIKTWSLLGKAKAAKVMHVPSPPCSRGETAMG